jgi:hypothetical protein
MEDADIEFFYLGFKQSMNNFYDKHTFSRPIELWSDNLNTLQKSMKYTEIQEQIKKIISLYAIDLMRTNDSYNTNILMTNIKRWNKISKIPIDLSSNTVFLLLDIYNSINTSTESKHLFVQVELYIMYHDFTELIKYSVEHNKMTILDKLLNYDQTIMKSIISIYSLINVSPKIPMNGLKLMNMIKKSTNSL